MENFQLVMRSLIGLPTLWCHAASVKSFFSFLTFSVIFWQQACQRKTGQPEPEAVHGSVSIKRLTEVLNVETLTH